MLRIFTYLTRAAGEPTVAGTYFDPSIPDISVGTADNSHIFTFRDGVEAVINDPKPQYENRGRLNILKTSVDLKSAAVYLGTTRYLGPVLYYHHREHLPICIFRESINGTHKKCYLCKILAPVDNLLTSQATVNTDEPILLESRRASGELTFSLLILLDGIYTDIDKN